MVNIPAALADLSSHQASLLPMVADPEDLQKVTGKTRKLGRVVIRGPQVSLISPEDGMEEIANPFLAAEEDDEE
jgi:hypothetical protein